MSGQLGLFAPLPPSIEGIDPVKAIASYSCDLIGMSNKVRKPVSCGGDLWVNTGGSGNRANRTYEMYRLIPVAEFEGIPTTYHEKTAMWQDGDEYPGDYARNDPKGFYHGMAVQNGSVAYVLYGPPQKLTINDLVETLDTTEDEDEMDEDEVDEDAIELAAARRISTKLCSCGHQEKLHDSTGDDRACYWSEGTGKQYRDCDCNHFDPTERTQNDGE